MLSPEICRALLSAEAQKNLSLPTAALILGALSQVENLMDLVDQVCERAFVNTSSS